MKGTVVDENDVIPTESFSAWTTKRYNKITSQTNKKPKDTSDVNRKHALMHRDLQHPLEQTHFEARVLQLIATHRRRQLALITNQHLIFLT